MCRVLVLGLDNAGKTMLCQNVLGRRNYLSTQSTFGINQDEFRVRGSCSRPQISITLVDVGGHSSIRSTWPRFIPDASGILVIIRVKDVERVTEAIEALNACQCVTKPHLIIMNMENDENDRKNIQEGRWTLQNLRQTLSQAYPSALAIIPVDCGLRFARNQCLRRSFFALAIEAQEYHRTYSTQLRLRQEAGLKAGLRFDLTKPQRERSLHELHIWNNEVDRCATILREKRLRSATSVREHPPSKRVERPITTNSSREKSRYLLVDDLN
ncbi:RAS like GTPase [Giardia muris]|uniref:RAS like GTPase n=1 Tax=Giardia muris TaxID=5742 RepID=A0A4Z1T6S0_GIAMU|nr:RAS like GTPase [Giardia muris]|eukprot:TNJ28239.1 RAS like GTPase [Giardia muris]